MLAYRAVFSDLLAGYVLFDHDSTQPREVGRTQSVVVVVEVLTVHAEPITQPTTLSPHLSQGAFPHRTTHRDATQRILCEV